MIQYTIDEYFDLIKKKSIEFGGKKNIQFVCCKCNTKQSFNDFIDSGCSEEEANGYIGFSCIGRINKSKGCDWSLGGLFRIHEVEVIDSETGTKHPRMRFA